MARYENQEIRNDKRRGRVYTTTITPKPQDVIGTIRIETEPGDRLDTLANRFYDDSTLWWIIARANGLGKGDFSVPNGKVLEIPNPREINTYLRRLDEIND